MGAENGVEVREQHKAKTTNNSQNVIYWSRYRLHRQCGEVEPVGWEAQKEVWRMNFDWIVYVLVGLAVGLSLGYVIGIRRGMVIVGALISGAVDGIAGAIKKE